MATATSALRSRIGFRLRHAPAVTSGCDPSTRTTGAIVLTSRQASRRSVQGDLPGCTARRCPVRPSSSAAALPAGPPMLGVVGGGDQGVVQAPSTGRCSEIPDSSMATRGMPPVKAFGWKSAASTPTRRRAPSGSARRTARGPECVPAPTQGIPHAGPYPSGPRPCDAQQLAWARRLSYSSAA